MQRPNHKLHRQGSTQLPATTEGSAGGSATVEQMGEFSFPASDPPAVWTWDVPQKPDRSESPRAKPAHPPRTSSPRNPVV